MFLYGLTSRLTRRNVSVEAHIWICCRYPDIWHTRASPPPTLPCSLLPPAGCWSLLLPCFSSRQSNSWCTGAISTLSSTYSVLNHPGINTLHSPKMGGFSELPIYPHTPSPHERVSQLGGGLEIRKRQRKMQMDRLCAWIIESKYLRPIICPIYRHSGYYTTSQGCCWLQQLARSLWFNRKSEKLLLTRSFAEPPRALQRRHIPGLAFLPRCFVCHAVITFQRNYEYTTLQLRMIHPTHRQP